jgi:hypothetical protein
MQSAATVLGVLHDRGRKGLSCSELYRQLFNKDLYLLAYGRIYANQGAMTPGIGQETADGMSEEKIGAIIEAMRHERYRFSPARRTYIPKKNGKLRPLGLPTWSDKLVGEVVRLLLEAYYEPQFSGHSNGYRPGRGCHTALRQITNTWHGTVWFIEADISDCFGSLDHEIMIKILAEKIHDSRTAGRCTERVRCRDRWRVRGRACLGDRGHRAGTLAAGLGGAGGPPASPPPPRPASRLQTSSQVCTPGHSGIAERWETRLGVSELHCLI